MGKYRINIVLEFFIFYLSSPPSVFSIASLLWHSPFEFFSSPSQFSFNSHTFCFSSFSFSFCSSGCPGALAPTTIRLLVKKAIQIFSSNFMTLCSFLSCKNIDSYAKILDGKCISGMRLLDNPLKFGDNHSGQIDEIALTPCMKQCWDCTGCRATDSCCPCSQREIRFCGSFA